MDSYIQKIREESPTLNKSIYLNHASTGPLHGRTAEALRKYAEFWENSDFEEASTVRENIKEQFAKLINGSKEELTFTPDVTHGTKIAVNLMNYDKHSNIVCYWNDYPGQVYQALYLNKTKNIEYRPVQDQKNVINPENFADKIDGNTKIVLLSHVQWLSGFKADIEEICKIAHENEAYVLIDTIQSTGAIFNDVRKWDVDFLTCGTAKWLLGPDQKGLFYMKKQLIDEFYPPFAGYHGTDYGNIFEPYWNVNKLEYLPTMDKFKDTNPGSFLYYVASKGMDIILDYGIKNVERRIKYLTDYLIEELQKLNLKEFITPLVENNRSGIVNVRVKDNIEVVKKLRDQRIITSSRFGGIRISPHFYNTIEDINKLVTELRKIV